MKKQPQRNLTQRDLAQRDLAKSQKQWFTLLWQVQGSVIPCILPRVLLCMGFALVVWILYERGLPVSLPLVSGIVPSIVLGLLLVFRTNTAYERFWEGRKLWGTMVNTTRNLARQIWVTVEENSLQDRKDKEQALQLIVGFAIATKLHLRKRKDLTELQPLLTEAQYSQLQSMNSPPLEIAFWLGDYLQVQHLRNTIHPYQQRAMVELLDLMVDVLGGCERILKTPIPLAYSIHLKQLLLIYCLTLPLQIVSDVGGWCILVAGLVAFAVFGIEAIGIEIENPFGCDPNDLPLDDICQTMYRNAKDLMTLTPSVEADRVRYQREQEGSV
ncbi:MAG: bestrophin family ion channel [Cyanobacteria bacterium P01_D01_bin.14]